MNWYDTLDEITALLATADDDTLVVDWVSFAKRVCATTNRPYHIERIRVDAERIALDRGGREKVRILDHGCGPGSTLIYLAALGFTGAIGVDVPGNDNTLQNRLARLAWGRHEDAFLVYDGRSLPFADASFDLIVSQQVVEHVPDAQYEAYFAEEGRLLAKGGIALHQIPHKLVPYDSHTDTWGLTLLPDGLARLAMKARGSEWPDHLHLRWPWTHAAMIERYIGPFRNLSAERLVGLQDIGYYDGSKGLRGVMASACALPVVGGAIASTLSRFVLMETRAEKR